LTQIRYGLAISLAYSSWEEGSILLAQVISICLRCAYTKGEGGSAPCGYSETGSLIRSTNFTFVEGEEIPGYSPMERGGDHPPLQTPAATSTPATGAALQGAAVQGAAVTEGTPGSNQESTPRDQFRSSEVSAALKGIRTLKEIYTGRGLEFFAISSYLGPFPPLLMAATGKLHPRHRGKKEEKQKNIKRKENFSNI
jgi:hypothetical protein